MSLSNDISGTSGSRAQVGVGRPSAPVAGLLTTSAPSMTQRLGGVFKSTFSNTMATVFERGAAGEFDDLSLALAEQAAIQRLRAAQQEAATGESSVAGGGPVILGGANAAPTAPEILGGANAAPTAPGAAAPGAAPPTGSATATADAIAAEREVHDLRVRQSEARLVNIAATLERDFPMAARLESASTGRWDPATFVPRSRDEVEAFAQRMVIDATEAAARLEIVATQLDAAKFEVEQGGGPAVQAEVTRLQADYDRQKTYVDKLAKIVDTQSKGQVAAVGAAAMSGTTMRDAGDMPVAELAAGLRESGMDEAQIRRIVGATELGVEQERTPGGSRRLKQVARDMTASLLAEFNRTRAERREEFRRQEEERAVERRRDDRRGQDRRAERERTREAQDEHAARRAAEFQQWLATVAQARAAQRRQDVG